MARSVADVLEVECAAVVALAASLTEDEFATPTTLKPWDVKALLAHMWRSLNRIPTALGAPEPTATTTDGVGYWRSYDPAADSLEIADHALETASEYETGRDLVDSFAELSARCRAHLDEHPPSRLIELPWGPRLVLEEFLKTRVLETVVHGIDTTDALEAEPVATEDGLSMVTATLAALFGRELPPGIRWTAVDFIRKGTGRVSLTEAEAAALGTATLRFPLLR